MASWADHLLPGNQKRFATSAHNFGRVVSPVVSWPFLRAILPMKLEARGVEPLSSSLSTQTSTCLSGEIFEKPTLHRHTADFRASTNFLHRPARSLRRPISLLSTF